MKLLFKQRLFSWFDSYDIYDENGTSLFVVKGKLSWGHCLKIYDVAGQEVGTVKERVWAFLPKFEMYLGDTYVGCICRDFSFFKPKYHIECNNWHVEGNFMGWDFEITDENNQRVAVISKQLFHLTDTYVIDVICEKDALCALMLVLAMDAEACSHK